MLLKVKHAKYAKILVEFVCSGSVARLSESPGKKSMTFEAENCWRLKINTGIPGAQSMP